MKVVYMYLLTDVTVSWNNAFESISHFFCSKYTERCPVVSAVWPPNKQLTTAHHKEVLLLYTRLLLATDHVIKEYINAKYPVFSAGRQNILIPISWVMNSKNMSIPMGYSSDNIVFQFKIDYIKSLKICWNIAMSMFCIFKKKKIYKFYKTKLNLFYATFLLVILKKLKDTLNNNFAQRQFWALNNHQSYTLIK